MVKNKIKIGLVGAGRIAGHHIRAIKKIKDFNIIAISDLDIQKAKKYSQKYNILVFSHYRDMLNKIKDIDLVIIMTPSGMHYMHALDILKKYKKSLVIEKPICMKTTEVDSLYKTAKKFKCKIYPVFQNRFNKSVTKLRKEIVKGTLGKIRLVNLTLRWCRPQRYYDLSNWRGTFSHDGGALTNQGIHFIDLLRYLIGDIVSVSCKMRTLGANIEVEDTAIATMEFKNGAIGTLEVTTSVRPKDDGAFIYIAGSKGISKIGGLSANKLEKFSLNESFCKKFSENIPDPYGFGHNYIYKFVKDDFTKKSKYPINFQDCRKTIQLLNSFYISDEKNKKINTLFSKNSKRLGRKNEKISKLYR